MRAGASRRCVGAALGGVLLAASLPTHSAGAADRVWRIGWLDLNPPPTVPEGTRNQQLFREAMRGLGYVEGHAYVIEARFADTDRASLPRLAQELKEARVDLIVTVGTPTTVAAKRATGTIPIVMTGSESPVERGLIASFAHPGGNVTGLTHKPGPEFAQKGAQLLEQVLPQARRFCILGERDESRPVPPASEREFAGVGSKPGPMQRFYNFVKVQNNGDLRAILERIIADSCDALFIYPEFVLSKFQNEIADFLEKEHLPAMVQNRDLIQRGGLLYYYTDFGELRRKAATYVDKIIKGTNPGDLPVEQPSKFEFIVNLKTARALGLTIPQSVMAFADHVIE